jgi:hypothetical protein
MKPTTSANGSPRKGLLDATAHFYYNYVPETNLCNKLKALRHCLSQSNERFTRFLSPLSFSLCPRSLFGNGQASSGISERLGSCGLSC